MDAATPAAQPIETQASTQETWIRHPLLPVAALVFALGFGFQGSRGLWQPDEGYNAAVTCEMLDSGDLLTQHLDGLIYLGKPPLYIWCTIPGVWIFGRNELGIRAFCAVCYVLTAWFVYLIGASMWKRREGVLAGLIYATMFLPCAAANIARPDAPLVLATTATLYCFWRSVMPSATRPNFWKMMMCIVMGWGFEMKATAVLVPVAPMFVYLLLTRQTVKYFATIWSIVGAFLFAAIGLSWYIYTAQVLPRAGAFLWDSLVVGRLVTDTYGRNPTFVAGLWIYIPALLYGPLPWLPFWIPLGIRLKRSLSGKSWLRELLAHHRVLLLVLWIVLPLIVYFLASSKLPLYILPVFPAMALLTARAMSEFMPDTFGQEKLSRGAWIFTTAWAVLLLGVKLGVAYYPDHKDEGAVWREIREKLPADCKRIVVVNEDLDGLRMYFGREIRRVTTGSPSADLVDFEQLPAMEQGMETSGVPLAVVYSKPRMKQAYIDRMESVLNKRKLESKTFPLDHDRMLVICIPKAD
jgi:4-amino-4-deoxy-L-arabinose transferase-like glycosyltransferase